MRKAVLVLLALALPRLATAEVTAGSSGAVLLASVYRRVPRAEDPGLRHGNSSLEQPDRLSIRQLGRPLQRQELQDLDDERDDRHSLLTSGFATVVNLSRLGFDPDPLTQKVGACGALKVEAQNDSGQSVDVDSVFDTVDVQLSTSSSTGAFYSDSSCTSPADSVSIAPGLSGVTVYYKDTTAQDGVILQADGDVIAVAFAEPEMFMGMGRAMIEASD